MAIYAITRHGIATAKLLAEAIPGADLFVSRRMLSEAPKHAVAMDLPMGPLLEKTFAAYDCHVHIISVGAVFRMLAPLINNKKVDPAVVCVDDDRRFAVCLLSGHVGRGNEFTYQVARAVQAVPVVTTASDVRRTLNVDILGRELGWQLDDPDRNVTRACAAVVNEERTLLVQECGEPNFWPLARRLPPGVTYVSSLVDVDVSDFASVLWVTDRDVDSSSEVWRNAVVFRPRSLVVGVGCDRGTPLDALRVGIGQGLASAGLCARSVGAFATVDLKADEPGLRALVAEFECDLVTFAPRELDAVRGVENPSDVVFRHMGTHTVAEGACLLAAGAQRLLVPKFRYRAGETGKNMTMAVARKPFPKREVT